ncbi:hypothetical protein FOL47_000709, partial [Perkinsus chesapeaki]
LLSGVIRHLVMNPFDTPPALTGLSFGDECINLPECSAGRSEPRTLPELNRYASPFVPSVARKPSETISDMGSMSAETLYYERCASRFTDVESSRLVEGGEADMIAVYQPTNLILQSCVAAERCRIPWHSKEPHIHMVPMLYNTAASSSQSVTHHAEGIGERKAKADIDDDDVSSAKSMLRKISGRWYCPSEPRQFEYEIRGSSVTKHEKTDKNTAKFTQLWKKRFAISKGDVYWSVSHNYVLSKAKFSRNEINWESTNGRQGWTWLRVPHTSDSETEAP